MLGIESSALLRGAAAAIAVSLPAAVVGGIADSDRGTTPPLVRVLFFVVLLGFVVGGFVAARSTVVLPYTTGALAAVAGFVVVQLVAVAVRLADDKGVPIAPVAFYAFVAYGCGLTGAVAGARRVRSS